MINYIRELVRGYQPISTKLININYLPLDGYSIAPTGQIDITRYLSGCKKSVTFSFELSDKLSQIVAEQKAQSEFFTDFETWLTNVELPYWDDKHVPISITVTRTGASTGEDGRGHIRYSCEFIFNFREVK